MVKTFIVLPSALKDFVPRFNGEMKWCYIGKEVLERERISQVLGESSRFYLRDRLHKTAEVLRQPFLDFVADLGKHQKDMINWWASRFASRSPFQTDFFLLLCYKALVEKIVKEYERGRGSICIFVEDPWLFSDLRENYRDKTNIEFIGQPRLVIRKFRFLVRGLIYRFLYACWLIVAWSVMFYYHGGRRPKVVKRGKNNVTILSYAEKRAFMNGKYLDPYTGELADLLEGSQISVLRLVYIKFPLSLSWDIGKLKGIVWPLIFDLRPWDLLLVLTQWWGPYIPKDGTKPLAVNGHSALALLNREWWEELSTWDSYYYQMFYKAMLRFLRKGWCQSLVYIYENQPWEKLLCTAVREAKNVKVIGYQHSSMPRFQLSQFLGKGEGDIIPLPDKILTTGRHLLEMYKEGGISSDRLSIGGAWRYEYLWTKGNKSKEPISKDNTGDSQKNTILIPLPVDPKYARALLFYLIHAFFEGCEKKNIELMLKPHPDTPLSVIGVKDNQLKGFNIVNSSVAGLLRKANVIVYNSSGVGLEALLYGNKKVIRYVPENLIDMDRIDWIPKDLVITIYDGDSFKATLSEGEWQKPDKEELNDLCQRYFSEVKPEIWLDELKGNLQAVTKVKGNTKRKI